MNSTRVTQLPGGWPAGPLGRAVADAGGQPLSVDPGGLGVVRVEHGGATAIVLAQAPPHRSDRLGWLTWLGLVAAVGALWIVWWPRSSSPQHTPQAHRSAPVASAAAPRSSGVFGPEAPAATSAGRGAAAEPRRRATRRRRAAAPRVRSRAARPMGAPRARTGSGAAPSSGHAGPAPAARPRPATGPTTSGGPGSVPLVPLY